MRKPASVSPFEKAGYALGDAACNFYWKTFEFFLLYYYTDVFGLAPSSAGTLFAVTRVLDGICDPVMGAIADRTQTRWGKFRPYLLWFAVPIGVAAVLTFTVPHFSGAGNLLYAYITYAGMMLAFTAINIPYSALMGVMSDRPEERTSISAYRYVGAFSAGLVVVFFTKRMVTWLGEGNSARGWQLAMVVWGILATAMFVGCFFSTRERVKPVTGARPRIRVEMADLTRNRPWLVLFLLSVAIMTTFWVRSAASLYYYKYALHREDLFEPFAVSCSVAMILGISLTTPLARLLRGKKWAYIFVMGTSSALVMLYYFIPPEHVAIIFGLSVAISFILGPQSPLLFAMYADTVDFSEWKSGRRSTGLIFAASTFALKAGSAFAGWITGMLLERFGYVANAAQSGDSLRGILLLSSFVPGVLGLGSAAILLFYPLDDRRMQKITQDLSARRQQPAERIA